MGIDKLTCNRASPCRLHRTYPFLGSLRVPCPRALLGPFIEAQFSLPIRRALLAVAQVAFVSSGPGVCRQLGLEVFPMSLGIGVIKWSDFA